MACYWKAWELAFDHFRRPPEGSPFVANYIDENFNESLFLFDTSFMTMLCNYAHPYVPGIQSLDNFYCTQREDGEIVREVNERTGQPHAMSAPGTPDSLNHPVLAWAERESYRITGDRDRLARVYDPLVRYYRSYEKIRDPDSGFYRTSWASMDNSPRIDGLRCGIDTTAEMVLFARDLAAIARVLGRHSEAERFEREAASLVDRINQRLWDDQTAFYHDWSDRGERHNVRTVAAYWTLLAAVPDQARAARLIAHLEDPRQFNRLHRVPTVPADEKGYSGVGEYWRGGVWAPINMMIVRGLERYGRHDLARDIALNHLQNVTAVFQSTGTIWEFYAPDAPAPGTVSGQRGRPDFVGWSGLAPIVFLIEHAIGIRIDAPKREIVWNITSNRRCGVENLWFAGITASLTCDPPSPDGTRRLHIRSTGQFRLILRSMGKSKVLLIPSGAEFHESF